jgi:hypothetical protein
MTNTATMRTGQFGRTILSKDGRTMTVHIPITLRHQGGRKQVVTPAGAAPWIPVTTRVDNTIVKAIVRAYRWRDMLESGRYATVRNLAKSRSDQRILPRPHPPPYTSLAHHHRSHTRGQPAAHARTQRSHHEIPDRVGQAARDPNREPMNK